MSGVTKRKMCASISLSIDDSMEIALYQDFVHPCELYDCGHVALSSCVLVTGKTKNVEEIDTVMLK